MTTNLSFNIDLYDYWAIQFDSVLEAVKYSQFDKFVDKLDSRCERLYAFINLAIESPSRSIGDWRQLGYPTEHLTALLTIASQFNSLVRPDKIETRFEDDSFVFQVVLINA
jgi:hypothetical protein